MEGDNVPVVGYMCRVDWEWEIGHASGGNRVYSSVKDLKKIHDCWAACGIVEVSVSFVKLIEAGTDS